MSVRLLGKWDAFSVYPQPYFLCLFIGKPVVPFVTQRHVSWTNISSSDAVTGFSIYPSV